MKNRNFIQKAGLAAALACCFMPLAAQNGADYYRLPVNIPISLSGNVGEVRSDHFHTGIDIRGGSYFGSPVYAVAEGYVSRIGVSPTGYGRVLYVTHPNGETSVYGHLNGFSKKIDTWVRSQQYARESFKVDLYPEKGKFPVVKGEQIATLGNSGSSGGPHLHFEIRDAQNFPRNILADGIVRVSDGVAPVVQRVLLYEVDTVQGVPVHRLKRAVAVQTLVDGSVQLADSVLTLSRPGYLAYESNDFMDGRTNTLGIYRLEQTVDGVKNFGMAIDRLSFLTTRYVNTMTSYGVNRSSRLTVTRAYLSPNNLLMFYDGVWNRGVITPPAPGERKRVVATIADHAGNSAVLRFALQSGTVTAAAEPEGMPVAWDRPFRYADERLRVEIPAKSLYESALLPFGLFADSTVQVGDYNVPLQQGATVWVRSDLPEKLRSKAILLAVNEKGQTGNIGGSWKEGGVEAEISRFSRYRVAVDTTAPRIVPATASGATLPKGRMLNFTVTDNLSGVASYRMTVDGKWALAEYDPKNRRISYEPIRDAAGARKHEVTLTITDSKQNRKTFKGTYIW